MRLTLALTLGVLLMISSTPIAVGAVGLEVATESGIVRGVATAHGREWRGIPYVAAPVGKLRWKAPQPAPSWPGVRRADQFGSQCIQLTSETETSGREDCLFLNVFAPLGARPGAPVPVMVHLHGGSNAGFAAYTDASAFVDRGVMVVTLNYRLGVFGFVGHEALSAETGMPSGEYGILDQIAALKWVQSNISGFGGDPHNVTLFGESSGSFDATALVASPLAIGLFRRAALQTETVWPLRDPGTIADAEQLGHDMSVGVGCDAAADVVRCLRRTPASELVVSAGFMDVAPWVGGQVLPASPLKLITRQTQTVPLLVGSNREEGGNFLFPHVFLGEPYPRRFWRMDTNNLLGPRHGDKMRELYRPTGFDSRLWAAVAMYTDAVYTCSIRKLASISDGPVWRYLYTHQYENDEFLNSLRAAHFLDEPMLWHDPELLFGFGAADYEFSDDEERLSSRMTGYWTNFAKTGDPNGHGLPNWPRYTDESERTLVLDEPGGVINHWRTEACDFFDRHDAP